MLFQLYSLQGELKHEQVTTLLTPILAKIAAVNQLLRKIYDELWPPTLDSFGLPSAINGHLRNLQESYPEIEFKVDFTMTATVSAYRITGRSLPATASTVWCTQRNGRAAWEAGWRQCPRRAMAPG